jgi:hypothetical protein
MSRIGAYRHWQYGLDSLLVRFAELGIDADMAAVCLCELWGIYCLLKRLTGA